MGNNANVGLSQDQGLVTSVVQKSLEVVTVLFVYFARARFPKQDVMATCILPFHVQVAIGREAEDDCQIKKDDRKGCNLGCQVYCRNGIDVHHRKHAARNHNEQI